MLIAVNVSWMQPGATGGMEHYVRNLIRELGDLDLTHRFVLLTSELNHDTFERLPPDWRRIQVPSDESNPSSFRRLPKGAGSTLRVLTDQGVDLVFCPLMYGLPLQDEIPTVITIPDLQHEAMPTNFEPWEIGSRSIGFESSIRRATAVITISETVADDVRNRYEVDESRLVAAPLGLNTDCDVDDATLDGYADGVRARHRIDYRYAFYPANCWPHKNHENLLRAFASLQTETDLHLVLTGSPMAYDQRVRPLVEELGLQDRVHQLGYVPREAIFGLYRAAEMLLFPSRFEGFGLPLLEAFRFDVPVACSAIPVLEEVGGPATITFDPESPAEIADALLRLAGNPDVGAELVELGRDRLALFNYRRTATITAGVFDAIERRELVPPTEPPMFQPLTGSGGLKDSMGRWTVHLPAVTGMLASFGWPVEKDTPIDDTQYEVSFVVDGVIVLRELVSQQHSVVRRVPMTSIDNTDPFHTVEILVESGTDTGVGPVRLHELHFFDSWYGRVRLL